MPTARRKIGRRISGLSNQVADGGKPCSVFHAMMYLLCILLPPLAVLLTGRIGAFLISLLLTLLGWLPGVIHAFFVVSDAKADKRTRQIVDALRHEQGR